MFCMLGEENGEEESNRIYKSIEVIFDLRQDHGVPVQSRQVVLVLKLSRVLAVPRARHASVGRSGVPNCMLRHWWG